MSGLKFGNPNTGAISFDAYIKFSEMLLNGGTLGTKTFPPLFDELRCSSKKNTIKLIKAVAKDKNTDVVVNTENGEESASNKNTEVSVSVDYLEDKRKVNISYPEERPHQNASYLEKYVNPDIPDRR